jgi:hypothetical protein
MRRFTGQGLAMSNSYGSFERSYGFDVQDRIDRACLWLEPGATSTEDQINQDQCEDQAKTAATVVAESRAHVVATTAEYENKNNQKNDKRHAHFLITPFR